ncbi:ATP-binding cassette domain-containing protein [Arcanobacterium hippocoleae]
MQTPCVVNNLSAAYRDRLALSNVSFEVPKGEIVAILGPNGAGKSTLIKAMLELIPRVSGEAKFFGSAIGKVRKRVAYMPQSASIDWDFPARVKDVVLMGTYARLGWLRRPKNQTMILRVQRWSSLKLLIWQIGKYRSFPAGKNSVLLWLAR